MYAVQIHYKLGHILTCDFHWHTATPKMHAQS